MKILKTELDFIGRQRVNIPKGSEILTAQIQRHRLALWFTAPTYKEIEFSQSVTIEIYLTGQEIPENPGKYIATFQKNDGDFVGHVFAVE